MSQKKKILFPTDFSKEADNSFPMAKYLAEIYEAELFVLHVVEPPAIKLLSSFDEAEAKKKASLRIDRFINENDSDKIIFNKMIKYGKAVKGIVDAAEEIDADYVIMGTVGLHGVSEYFSSTHASRVIRSATCPVMVVPEQLKELSFSKILMPLDLSRETGEKVRKAVEFAKIFGSKIIIFSVLSGQDEEEHKRLRGRMEKAASFVKKQEVEVQTSMIISKDNVADVVMAYSHEVSADLLLVMTQQEKDIKEVLLGSNAAHIVNNSRIPVLCMKPQLEYRDSNYSSAVFG